MSVETKVEAQAHEEHDHHPGHVHHPEHDHHEHGHHEHGHHEHGHHHEHHHPEHGHHHPVEIRIDHKPYTTAKNPMTGTELRTLATPHISSSYDLWLENPGPEDDIKVGDAQELTLKSGMHFYSSPATINPGGDDGFA